ncbi:PT domain-containing protein [Dactylosporangium cerinum]|uniref:PT domain-containing protein n=1 Tax=Dactylosporangium cerinum TaxID=1434730 RepID=A0ABV9VRD1_9ACTN
MHLFFNDPRVAYVTRHRRIVRHPLMALLAGGVGVAALGVVIGAAGWEPPQQGRPAPQAAHQGVAMPDPVQDINLYGVPAAPQPILDLGPPPRTSAAPARPQQPAKANANAKAKAKQAEKARTATAAPTTQPPTIPEPTAEPTAEPTTAPTQEPTTEPTAAPTRWHPGVPHEWPHDNGHWPWEQGQAATAGAAQP